jgi:hypothetical protein
MSLAVLARKSRATNPRSRSDKCFILNMTGRGKVLGMSAKYHSGNCRGKCKMGLRSACCTQGKTLSKDCKKGCGCNFSNGMSQPAPQMGYGVYLNKKSNGTYHPSGQSCCDNNVNKIVWKQQQGNMSASEIIEKNKLESIRCMQQQTINPRTGKPVAKQDSCAGKNKACPENYNGCKVAIIKPRLSYTRMNHWCGSTKSICKAETSSQQIALVKSRYNNVQCS